MNEELIEAKYDVTKKSKLRKFYESNKLLIFSTILFLIITVASTSFYLKAKEQKKMLLADNYVEAKIYLSNDEKNKAKNILMDIILANDSTYSTLSFFLLLNENLITDQEELSNLFDHILENNKFEKEVKNLIIFKKVLFLSNFVNESELLQAIKPLISAQTLWKPHALLLLGDYYVSKKEYSKAKEFYNSVLSLNNLHNDLYKQAKSQLKLITHD